MSFKRMCKTRAIGGVLLAFALAGPAGAQVQSSGLGEPDLWSVGFLENRAVALPEEAWAASDSDDLLTLTRAARTRNLSPAVQMLMRRLVLSPATAPNDDKSDDLLAERARLMFQIGESSAAAQLLPTLKTAPRGLKVEEVAVDLQLALGQSDAACLNGAGDGREGDFWVKLRAVCFALSDNFEEAELAMELAIGQGVNDPWLTNAIFAASGALPNKPAARFDNGMALAMSAKAELEPSVSTIANSRLDLAAAIARQDTFSPAMRVQAAGVAAEAGLLDAGTHRALYKALVETDGFRARTPLEVTLQTTLTPGNDAGAKARTLRAALRTARGNTARFSAVSRLLLQDIKALTPSEGTSRMALEFAYASLAAGAPEEAQRWIAGSSGVDGDKFERIWSAGVMALAGTDLGTDAAGKITSALVEEAKTSQQKAAVTRLLVLWSAMDISLPPEARALLANTPAERPTANGDAVSPLLLASVSAAAKEQAAAEVILRLSSLTKGDPYKLAAQDVGALVAALRILGQEDAARMLALEATGYWRSSL